LFKVEGTGRRRLDAADSPPELGYVRPHSRIAEYADAEGERDRADVIASLQRQA